MVGAQLAFVTTTSDSFRQIKLWTSYHQSLGVGRFYLFVDGQVRRWPRAAAAADVCVERNALRTSKPCAGVIRGSVRSRAATC